MIIAEQRAQAEAQLVEVSELILAKLRREHVDPRQIQRRYLEAMAEHPLAKSCMELAAIDARGVQVTIDLAQWQPGELGAARYE